MYVCLTSQKLNIKHQKPLGIFKPLKIPVSKYDIVALKFVSRLPKSPSGCDAMWVVIDQLIKSISFQSTWSTP